jgi:hypothetical protein
MTSSETTSTSHRFGARVLVISAVGAVIAALTGPAIASASPSRAASLNAPHTSRPAVPRHHLHAAFTHTRMTAPAAKRFTPKHRAHPAAPSLHLTRPARPAKPVIKTRKVSLWHGTPSYTVSASAIHAKPNLTVPASCKKSGSQSGTWSASACPSGYEVTGDVTVPTSHTLTVSAGTTVYFDTTMEGSLGTADPSELADLIVDGTLKISGTTAQPVTFTSANAAPSSSSAPAPGDWGYVFFNHTGSAKGGGSMTHLTLQYGEGLATDGVAPSLTHSTVSQVAAGETTATIASSIVPHAGIDYEDVPSGAVVFANDTFDGAEAAGIEVRSDYGHTNFAGGSVAGHSFTFQLTNSSVTGGYSSAFDDAVNVESDVNGTSASANNSAIKLDVTGNQITQTSHGFGLDVLSYTAPSTVVGTAAITGSFHDNVISGGSSSSGVFFEAQAEDTSSTGTKTCSGASACVVVPFLHDQISAEDDAVETEAYAQAGGGRATISTPVGEVKKVVKKRKHHKKVTKLVDVSGGSYSSVDDNAWYIDAEAYGTGAANLSMPIVASAFNAYDTDVSSDVTAYRGTATNTESARHSTMVSANDQNFYIQTYGSYNSTRPAGSSGAGNTNLSITGGTYTASSYNVQDDDTYGDYGPANSHVSITGATLTSASDNVYGEVYGSDDGGSGGGTSTVSLTSDRLTAYDGNVDNYVYGYHQTAPATASVKVSKSTLESYNSNSIDNEAYAAEDSGSSGNAATTTNVTSSTVQGYDTAVYSEAESYYNGTATSSPHVTNSRLTASDDYGIENYAYSADDAGSGAAVGSPVIRGSVINSYDEALYNEVASYYGKGAVTASPQVSSSTLTSDDEYAIYNEGEGTDQAGSSGSATGNPQITSSKVYAYDNAIYNEVYGYYGSGTGSPVIKNSDVISADDAAIYNEVYGSEDGGFGAATGSPKITNSKVRAYDEIIDNEIYSYGGKSTGSPSISGSTTSSHDDYGIYNEVESTETRVGSGGSAATANPVISGSTVNSYDEAIYNDVYGYRGPATGNPAIKAKSTVASNDDDAIYNEVYADYSEVSKGHTATGNPMIDTSTVWAYDDAIDNNVYSYEGAAVGNPKATSDTLYSDFDYAIYNEVYGSEEGNVGPATANPSISHSTVEAYDQAIYNEAYAYHGTSSTFSKSGNAVANPSLISSKVQSLFDGGIYNEAFGSHSDGNGSATGNPKVSSTTVNCGDCSSEYGLYNYTESGGGAATANPVITNSPLTINDGYGVYNEAYSAYSGGHGPATANPVITSSPIVSYYYGLYNYADASHGNSAANGSFQVTSSRVHSGYYEAIDAEAYGSGSGVTTLNPTAKNDLLEAPDDDGIDLDTATSGAGGATTGGSITGTTIRSEGEGVYFYSTGNSTGTSKVTTQISGDSIKAASSDGIYADFTTSAPGGSLQVTPTIKSTPITASDDYAIYLDASGPTAASSDVIRVAPVISSSPSISDDGIYLNAADSATIPGPGTVQAAGSLTGSPVTAYDSTGVASYATCNTCGGGSAETFSVKNSSITGEDAGVEVAAVTNAPSTASARLGGSVTSTSHKLISAADDPAVYGYSYAYGGGNATDQLSVKGVTLSGEEEGIYNRAYSASGSATNSSSFTNNVIKNTNASDGYDGIENLTEVNSGSGKASRSGVISGNTISGLPGSNAYAVEDDVSSTGTSAATTTIAHNRISNVGGYGIFSSVSAPTVTSSSSVAVDHNTVGRTGYSGIYVAGARAKVTNNVVRNNGLIGGTALDDSDGVYVAGETTAGAVTCNVVWGDVNGLDYVSNTAGADPTTTNNAFRQPSSTVRNSTDLRTNNTGTTHATSNYWGGTPRVVNTSTGTVTTTPRLSAAPKCTKSAGA